MSRKYWGLIYVFVLPALAFGIIFLADLRPKGTLDTTLTGVAAFDACEDTCLIVYLAPWCPACKEIRPTAVELAEELAGENVDVAFVIGSDSSENCEAYAEGLPGEIHLDPDSSFTKKVNVRSFPTFIVRQGWRTVKMQAGGIPQKDVMRRMLGL